MNYTPHAMGFNNNDVMSFTGVCFFVSLLLIYIQYMLVIHVKRYESRPINGWELTQKLFDCNIFICLLKHLSISDINVIQWNPLLNLIKLKKIDVHYWFDFEDKYTNIYFTLSFIC